MLLAPGREVADLRRAVFLARFRQPAVEGHAQRAAAGPNAENAPERLVGKGELALPIELRHPDGQPVQHGTLRFGIGAVATGLLFHVLDIDGISGNAFALDRQVADTQRAPFPVDGRLDDAFDRLRLLRGLPGDLRGGEPVHAFHQFDLLCDHIVGRAAIDCLDIGGIDQPQLRIAPAEPHRHGRRLDQIDQRSEVALRTARLFAHPRKLGLALAEIEDPHDGRPARRNLRVCQIAPEGKAALRTRHAQLHPERRRRFLRAADMTGQLLQLFGRQAGFLVAVQFAQEFGHFRQAEPVRQACRPFDPAIAADQQRDCRRLVDHAGEATCGMAAGLGLAVARTRRDQQPGCGRGPRRQQQRDEDQCCGGQFHGIPAIRAGRPMQRLRKRKTPAALREGGGGFPLSADPKNQ